MQLNNNVDADFVWIISGKYYDIAYKIGSLSELFCMSNLAYSNTNQVIETIYMPIHLKYSLLWATGASTSLWLFLIYNLPILHDLIDVQNDFKNSINIHAQIAMFQRITGRKVI